MFQQIFMEREYAPLCDLRDLRRVVDCGANAGYSSAFFLTQFPGSQIIAVEPDSGNFPLLERNLSAYGNRARLVRAGVWSESVPLKVSHERYRDGREWAVPVQPCPANEVPDFQGIDIPTLLSQSGFDRISLLKMDIEGAEVVVLQADLGWLDRVDAMAIELHDDSSFGKASEVVQRAMQGRDFEITRHGELTICRRAGKPSSVFDSARA